MPGTNRSGVGWCLAPTEAVAEISSTDRDEDVIVCDHPASAYWEFGEFPRDLDEVGLGSNLESTRCMGRDPRVLLPGGTYHVMNRGNHKEPIFDDDKDRGRFRRKLIAELQRYNVEFLAGCPLGNHFHAIVNTPHGNLPDFMEQWQGQYARYSNWRYKRVGHLFQGRYRGVVIEHDIQLLTALCYVFYNPVSAGFCDKADGYKWSTYAATVGLAPRPEYLSIDWLLALFPESTLEEAQKRFHDLMTEGDPLFGYFQRYDREVDAGAVKRVIRSYTGEQLQLGMLPQMYRSSLRSSLDELFPDGMSMPERALAIYDAHVSHGYRLAEIARKLGVSSTTVSKIFHAIRSRRAM
jgi:putative transposase